MRYFTESAEAGDARAATNLAVLLSRGDGVAKDPAAAVRWYGVAAQSKTKSKLRDMHDLRSVPRPPPPTPPPPPPVRTFSEEAPDVSTSTNARPQTRRRRRTRQNLRATLRSRRTPSWTSWRRTLRRATIPFPLSPREPDVSAA